MNGLFKFKKKKQESSNKTIKLSDDPYTSRETFKENPYLAAKLIWNDRYGSEVSEKQRWKIFCFSMILANCVLVGTLAYITKTAKFVPYAVEINALSQPVGVKKLDVTGKLDPKVVSSQLAQFIVDLRTVTTDGKLKKKMQERVYSLVSAQNGANSLNMVNEFWRKNDPFEIAKVMNISVQVTSIVPENGSNSYHIQWTETAIVNGHEEAKINWTGYFEVAKTDLNSWEDIINNPTGLLVKSISWSQII